MTRWVAAAGLVLLSLLAATRVDMASDLERLVSPGPQRTALSAVDAFGGRDAVLVEVSATPDTLAESVRTVSAALTDVPGLVDVRASLGAEEALAVSERIAPHAAAFVPPDVLAERLSDTGMREAMEHQLARLSSPGGGGSETRIRRDPLDLEGLALAHLRAPSSQVTVRDGLFGDGSDERALVFARSDGADAQAVATALAETGVTTRWFAGLRVATDTERTVRADVQVASWLGMALLLAVLVFGFRSVRAVLGAVPMVALAGCGIALGAWLAGPIHPVQLGFAAALLGIAVDYWVHLVSLATGRPARQALAALLPGLAVSVASTAGAFGILALSDEPVVRVLGLTGAGAVLMGGLAVVLLGPALVRSTPPRPASERAPSRLAALATVVVVGALVPFVAAAPFDADPRHLLATSDALAADQQYFRQHYGLTGDIAAALVTGDSVEQVQERAAQVEERLSRLDLVPVAGPDTLVPSPWTQHRLRSVVGEDLQQRIDVAADSAGFRGFPGAARRIEQALSEPVPADLWDGTPLAPRIRAHRSAEGRTALVTMPLLPAFARDALADTARTVDGVTWIEPSSVAQQSLVRTRDALVRGGFAVSGLLLLGLWLRYRSLGTAALALAPAGAALIAATGVLGLLGMALNVVGLAVVVLVLGLAVDYGVFTVEALRSGHSTESRRAITLSSLTSLVGIAPLMLATSPALRVAGVVLTAGVLAAAITSRVVVPAVATGWPSPRARTWTGRVAWAVAMFVVLDTGWMLANSFPSPTGGSAPPPPVTHSGRRSQVGPNILQREDGVWVLRTTGTPWEVGVASGLLTLPLRERLEDELYDSFHRAISNPAFRWLITRGAAGLGRTLPSHIRESDLLEIAGSASVHPDRYWLQGSMFTRKVHYHAIHDMGQALVDTPLMGCTAFAAGGAATTDGHWILARNFDFDGGTAFDRDKVVRVHSSPGHIDYLSVAFAGMVGAVSGVNADGIAVSINAAGTDATPRIGTPMTLIVREILQNASSLDDAEHILTTRSGFVAENVLVVDGDAGEAAVFEVSPDRVVRVPVDQTVSVANHFVSDAWADDPVNLHRMQALTTVPRLQRMTELVDGAFGRIDLDVAQDILTDRLGVAGAPLPRGHRHALDADIATHGFIVDATTRTVRVSRFPHLSAGFLQFDLDDMLAGDLDGTRVGPSLDVAGSIARTEGRDLLRQALHGPSHLAEDRLRDAVAKMPGHPEPLIALAEHLAQRQRCDEAQPLIAAAQSAPPEYAVDYERIASVESVCP